MDRKFEQLSEDERQWVGEQLARAREFARETDPDAEAEGEATLNSLDRAWERYLATEIDESGANDIVSAVGVALGSALVKELGFEWVIVTDDWGTELAVLARPGRGDVSICPIDFVSKRYERREAPFLEDAIAEIRQSVREIAADWGDAG